MSDVRIYYENEIYTGPPEGIPSPVGVVAVVTTCKPGIKNNIGRFVLAYYEWYIYEKGYWFGLFTVADLIDHVLFEKPNIVLKGRWIPDHKLDQIMYDANTFDLDGWPEKTGTWRARESTDHRKRGVT